MKNLLGLVLLSVSLSACSQSCSKHDTATVSTVTSAPTVVNLPAPKVKLEGSTWSLELPSGFEKLSDDKPGLELFYSNKEKKELVSLTKEPFGGATKDYALEIIAALHRSGVGPGSSDSIKIGDAAAIQIECAQDGMRAWITTVVKNGNAYVFSCGGTDDNKELKETCSVVLASLVIK